MLEPGSIKPHHIFKMFHLAPFVLLVVLLCIGIVVWLIVRNRKT